ncbi:helix-turn-helix domain-containing protein [Paenibacillus amylolyticus]|uniref:AraC family transcriptional regulator n=2 Tax=Paenibacillus amylolyticus TaxID=1451 RepID=UPI00105A419E|nr:AraC family transcriptional regulator [Paenibacillus amylolyticus]TDL62408.1 helix-turn-helix domain-containing protein [Paenibacillus amylolyticus]
MIIDQEEHFRFWEQASIRDIHVERAILAKGERTLFKMQSSSFFCIKRGNILVLLNQKTYSIHPFEIIHAPSKSLFEVNAGSDGAEYILISYKAERRSTYGGEPLFVDERKDPTHITYRVTLTQPMMLYEIADRMLETRQQEGPSVPLQLKASFYQWVYHMVEQYVLQSPVVKTASPVELVTQTLEYLLQNYAKPHTLDSLAGVMGRSPGHLSNCFKQVLDRGPIDCLIRLRMQKAYKLLAETKLPLRVIASSIGYQDAYYFSNAFKKYNGISPQMYRKQIKEEDVISLAGRNHIVGSPDPCYIPSYDNDNYYQYLDGGSEDMLRNIKRVPIALLLAFGLVLSACSGGSSVHTGSAAGDGSTAQSEATAGEASNSNENNTNQNNQETKRIVNTSMGEVEVPASPQRVVTDFFLGHILALNVKPVGSNGLFMQNPYLEGQVSGIEDVSDNLEAITGLNPDLIVTGNAQSYEAYSKIATTVYLDNSAPVRDQVKELGVILGNEAEASAWLIEFEKNLASAKERLSGIIKEGESATVFAGGIVKNITLYGNAYTGRGIHGELGIPMNDNVQREVDPKVGWATISSEIVEIYAGDRVFMAVDAKAESFDYASDPVWGTLDAVKNNELYEIDGYKFYFSDPISVMGQIQDIVDMMEERALENSKK